MRLRDTKYGYWKHLACAALLVLAAHLNVRADPISGGILITLAISAALTAASIGLQMLFAPKPKPQDKNKLQGDLKLTNVGEDIPMPEVYGSSLGDGIGGVDIGGIIVYASPIRKVVVTVPGQTQSGGKGAPKAPPTREHHYYIDLAIIVANRGPYRVKRIKANADVLYQSFTPNTYLNGAGYEAEGRTSDSGGVTNAADVDMSGGIKANLDQNEWIQWNNVAADSTDAREMYIVYKSTDDADIELTVNGTVQNAVLPDSFGIRANVNLPQSLTVGSGNTIRIKNLTNTVLSIDRIVVGYGRIIDLEDGDLGGDGNGCWLSGAKYEGWTNPEPTFDHMTLRDPLLADRRACELWNYQSNRNALGEVAASAFAGANIRIYPGNKTQLPDPMLQEYFEATYGAGSTPAFRNRCYVVLENFEITKYGSVPNFTFVVEHESINSLGELCTSLADRAGLEPDEYDFSELEAVPVRGYPITERRSPAKTMELFGRFFDVDFHENDEGVIVGVVPDETVAVTIPIDELGSVEGKNAGESSGDEKPFTPVVSSFRDESELPGFLDVGYIDPLKDFEISNVHSLREINGSSQRKANVETGLVMTTDEAQKFADRDLHKTWVEKDGLQISAFAKHAWISPTMLIKATDTDGSTPAMRVKSKEGWIPGRQDIRGVSRDAVEFPPRNFVVAENDTALPTVTPPAPIIGTFVDMATFREEQGAGFYVAAAMTDPHYRWQSAGLYREIEGGEYEALDGIPNEATLGRTITGADGTLGDADPPALATPLTPTLIIANSGGSVAETPKTRRIKITYYDGADESLPSTFATVSGLSGASNTITVDSPVASTGATHYRVYHSLGNAAYELQNGAGTAIGVDLVLTSITTGTAQPPTIWDDTNEVTVDLFHGELETLTDDQVLEGRNFAVVGNEILQFGTATRDNGYPNRWVLSHLLRGLKGTEAAAVDHGDEERFLLYTEAWRWIAQDPALANETRTYKFMAAGDDLDKAWSVDFNWSGRTQYNTGEYAAVDPGVPVLSTDAPTLATEASQVRVFIKRPISNVISITNAEVRFRNNATNAHIMTRDIGLTVTELFPVPSATAKVDYRWRNRYRIDGSDGWSAWSNTAVYSITTPPGPGGDGDGGDPGDIGGVCFADGTLVLMADGSDRLIQDMQPGDLVLAWTPGGKMVPARVKGFSGGESALFQTVAFDDGDEIQATKRHAFAAEWHIKRAAEDLAAGDTVRAWAKGWQYAEVSGNEVARHPRKVRANNWEIDTWHTYFVRGNKDKPWKAVHNAKIVNSSNF